MEYSLLNNSLGSLAFQPSCLSEDNLCDVNDPLLCDLYLNDSIFVGTSDPSTKENDNSGICNDFNFSLLNNDFYSSLDYMLEDDASSLQHSNNGIFGDISDNNPLQSSCSSTLSVTSLDDLSFDLLENLDADEVSSDNRSSDDDMLSISATPLPSCGSPISSIDDLSFELLETLETDECVSDNEGFNSFNIMDTPICSPTGNLSSVDVTPQDLIDLLMMTERAPHTEDFISTEYVKQLESENEDILSPKSVDSGISVSSDETNDDSDNCFLEQLNVYPSLSQNYNLLQGTSQTDYGNIDFVNESKNFTGDRYAPYTCKKKTPEQKLRKKKQNRNAACKYRSKKKGECSSIFDEADKLDEKNKELKGSVEKLRQEIDYLKSLMLDVIQARLSQKSNAQQNIVCN